MVLFFFNFWPQSLRNGNKGQNQGHSSRAFIYGLLVNFFGQQSGFWYRLPPQKVSSVFEGVKCLKGLLDGQPRKIVPYFCSVFCLSAFIFHRKRSKSRNFLLEYGWGGNYT